MQAKTASLLNQMLFSGKTNCQTREMLSEIAINDPEGFKAIVAKANAALA